MVITEQSRFDRFFSEAGYLLQHLKKIRNERDLYLASAFNVFDYVNANEAKLSKIIADLLRPNGQHGQGTAFLIEFFHVLNLFKDDSLEDEILAPNRLIAAKIQTECPAGSRRMDIVIDIGTWGFLIESKAFGAGDQLNQLEDYVQEMRRRFNENFFVIYLAQGTNTPSTQSLSAETSQKLAAEGKLCVRECAQFICNWIESCRKICKAEKIKYFLSDLMQFINQEIAPREEGQTVMSTDDQDIVLEYALRNPENLEIALRVSAHLDGIRRRVLEYFGREITKQIATKLKPEWKVENRGMFEKCEGVRISKRSWNDRYWIELAPDKRGGQAVWLGIRDPSNLLDRDATKKEIDSKYQKGSSMLQFPWFYYLDKYRNLGDVENLLRVYEEDSEVLNEMSKRVESFIPIAEVAIEKFSPA